MPLTILVEEAKAKEKVCPLSFGASLISEIREPGPWPCAGSGCMAWRWARTHINDGNGGTKPSDDTHGYCGMASIPYGAH